MRATGAFGEGSEQTFSAYTSPRGVDNAWVSYRDQNGARLEWDPVPGADQYKVVNTDSGKHKLHLLIVAKNSANLRLNTRLNPKSISCFKL